MPNDSAVFDQPAEIVAGGLPETQQAPNFSPAQAPSNIVHLLRADGLSNTKQVMPSMFRTSSPQRPAAAIMVLVSHARTR